MNIALLQLPLTVTSTTVINAYYHRYDLFESLGDAHDRALPWLQTKGILNLASEIISFCLQRGFGKAPPVLVPELQQEEEGGRASLAAPVDPYLQLMSASSITNYARVKHQEALRHEKLAATEGIAQKQVRIYHYYPYSCFVPTAHLTSLSISSGSGRET